MRIEFNFKSQKTLPRTTCGTKISKLRNWNLFSFYKSTNIFGSTRGLGLRNWNLFSFYKSFNNFDSTMGSWLRNCILSLFYKSSIHFGSTRVFWAQKLNFIFILQIYQHFCLYKELENIIYVYFTNLLTILALQGVLDLKIDFKFHSTNYEMWSQIMPSANLTIWL